MSRGGPSSIEMDSYQVPSSDYPGESVSGDTTVQGRDYRANSVDYFKNQDSNGGTVVSYATTSGYNTSQGVPDIDFDDKQGDAYESIDRYRDRRVVATPKGDGKCPSPSSMPDVRKPGQFDMPDYVTKKGWMSLRKCLCFFICLSLLTLFIALAGTAIGVYAFLTAFEGGRILGGTSDNVTSSDPAVAMLQSELEESQNLIEQLQANFAAQSINFEQLSLQVASIITPTNVTSNNETNSTNSNGLSFENCETTIQSSCIVEHTQVQTGTPAYSACDTIEVPLEQTGLFLADIYCSVDNRREVNPISSTLNIFDNKASCSCTVIHSTTPGGSITCNLYVKTCPMWPNWIEDET